MPKKESTIVNAALLSLFAAQAAGRGILLFLTSPYEWRRQAVYGTSYNSYRNSIYNLQKRGLISIIKKGDEKFLKLTKKGELEALLAKAKLPDQGKWDGKWRLIIFDIPEGAKLQRNHFRRLLKKNGFYKLQGSVYVNPYPLNREALEYLKQTGLINYIRILKVEEMDNDKSLRKKFGLS